MTGNIGNMDAARHAWELAFKDDKAHLPQPNLLSSTQLHRAYEDLTRKIEDSSQNPDTAAYEKRQQELKKYNDYKAVEYELRREARRNQAYFSKEVSWLCSDNVDHRSKEWADRAENIFKMRAENPYYDISNKDLLKLMHRACENEHVCPNKTPYTHAEVMKFENIGKGAIASILNETDRSGLGKNDVTSKDTANLTEDQANRVIEQMRIRVSNATNTPEWLESGKPRITDFKIDDPKAMEKYRPMLDEISGAVTFHRTNIEGVQMQKAVAEATNGKITDFDINNPETFKKYSKNDVIDINNALAKAGKQTVEDQLQERQESRENNNAVPSPYETAEQKKVEQQVQETLKQTPPPANVPPTKSNSETPEKEQSPKPAETAPEKPIENNTTQPPQDVLAAVNPTELKTNGNAAALGA